MSTLCKLRPSSCLRESNTGADGSKTSPALDLALSTPTGFLSALLGAAAILLPAWADDRDGDGGPVVMTAEGPVRGLVTNVVVRSGAITKEAAVAAPPSPMPAPVVQPVPTQAQPAPQMAPKPVPSQGTVPDEAPILQPVPQARPATQMAPKPTPSQATVPEEAPILMQEVPGASTKQVTPE